MEAIPFKPMRLFFLSTTLMMPPELAASNLAEGLVINSILSIWSAGIWSRVNIVGLPSTNICGVLLRSSTFPSISTETDGIFFMISTAVPPVASKLLLTSNTFRSMPICKPGRLAVTITSPSCLASVRSDMLPRSFAKFGTALLSTPGKITCSIDW